MIKHLLLGCALACLAAGASPAQSAWPAGYYLSDGVTMQPVSAAHPLPVNTGPVSGNINATITGAGNATYFFTVLGYNPYATATDIIQICGASNVVTRVTQFILWGQATAATQQSVTYTKRSSADTGGTPTSVPLIPVDANDAPAASTVSTFAAAPSLGALAGSFPPITQNFTLTTAAPAEFPLIVLGGAPAGPNPVGATSVQKNIILRGAAQCMAINLGGGATPGGSITRLYGEITESAQ